MPSETPAPRFVPTSVAASYVGHSESTLEKWRMVPGAGPAFIKVGKRVVYDLRVLDAFMTARQRDSTDKAA